MEAIIVNAVAIIGFDQYWKLKQEIIKMEEMISRGFGQIGMNLDTPFAVACGDTYLKPTEDYLADIKKAVSLFEEKYPKKSSKFEFVDTSTPILKS